LAYDPLLHFRGLQATLLPDGSVTITRPFDDLPLSAY
jgi:hypothetical protein